MKKLAALILAILMFCTVYGVMASEDPYFHTIREALDTSEGYAAINETDDFVTLILEKDGKTLCQAGRPAVYSYQTYDRFHMGTGGEEHGGKRK